MKTPIRIIFYIHASTSQNSLQSILADCIGLSQTSVYRAKHPPESLNFIGYMLSSHARAIQLSYGLRVEMRTVCCLY